MTCTVAPQPSSHRPSRFARLAAVLTFGAMALAPAAAQACNPFEILFGGCRERPVVRYYEPAPAYRPSLSRPAHREARTPARTRRAVAAVDGNGVSKRQTPLKASADAPIGSLALFAEDRTLRPGDVVVTDKGFKVFRNDRFAPIPHNSGELSKMEQVSMMQPKQDFASVGPDAIRPAGLVALRYAARSGSTRVAAN